MHEVFFLGGLGGGGKHDRQRTVQNYYLWNEGLLFWQQQVFI